MSSFVTTGNEIANSGMYYTELFSERGEGGTFFYI